jgi:hypothetical protein
VHPEYGANVDEMVMIRKRAGHRERKNTPKEEKRGTRGQMSQAVKR